MPSDYHVPTHFTWDHGGGTRNGVMYIHLPLNQGDWRRGGRGRKRERGRRTRGQGMVKRRLSCLVGICTRLGSIVQAVCYSLHEASLNQAVHKQSSQSQPTSSNPQTLSSRSQPISNNTQIPEYCHH